MSKILKTLNQILQIMIPYSIAGVIFFLFLMLLWAPELLQNSLPELIGTFVGAVLGFELGAISERRKSEEEKKELLEYEKTQRIQDRVYIYEAITDEAKDNIKI